MMRQKYKKENVVYQFLKKGTDLLDYFLRNKRYLLLGLLVAAIILFFALRHSRILFTILLIGLGAVSMLYQRYFRYAHYIGFELCMMATVLTSITYGPHYGAFVGFASITGAFILSGNFKYSSFISVLALPLIGLIVPFFSGLSLLYLGMLMTIIYDAVILPLYVLMGSRIMTSAVFFITHIFFNFWVFSVLAPFLLSLMI